jgi:hypothetical protein
MGSVGKMWARKAYRKKDWCKPAAARAGAQALAAERAVAGGGVKTAMRDFNQVKSPMTSEGRAGSVR